VQLIQMMRADKQEAAEIDAELDARDAARAAARAAAVGGGTASAASPVPADAGSGATSATHEADEADEAERPWWESDPRLTDRFKRA
jgi:hypothetical protein